jgi:8-oxo-dGTP diphosphatase
MERNLDRRVEVLVRVDEAGHVARIGRVLELALHDRVSAWTLAPDGTWRAPADADGASLQSTLVEEALRDAPADTDAPILAAGGVVWRVSDGRLEVAVIHRPRYDDWSFPKGKLQPGEDPLAAAIREVGEETGFSVLSTEPIGDTRYVKVTAQGHRHKVVTWWAMQAFEGEFEPSDEVDALRWLAPPEAAATLTRETDRTLLVRAIAHLDRRWQPADADSSPRP